MLDQPQFNHVEVHSIPVKHNSSLRRVHKHRRKYPHWCILLEWPFLSEYSVFAHRVHSSELVLSGANRTTRLGIWQFLICFRYESRLGLSSVEDDVIMSDNSHRKDARESTNQRRGNHPHLIGCLNDNLTNQITWPSD